MSPTYLKVKAKLYWYYATLLGKVPFRDKFGLRYYLWRNTRLRGGVIGGVRTDDTGVLVQLFAILDSLVERRAKSEIVCFDVGAFIGVITLAMVSRLEDQGKVYAFEPSSLSYSRLLDNIRLNQANTVSPQNVALLDSVGDAVLKLNAEEPGQSLIVDQDAIGDGRKTGDAGAYENVHTTTIYDFAKRNHIDAIDILKIDAEHSDHKVIAGASPLLEKGAISYIVHEVSREADNGYDYGRRSVSILESHGYENFYIVRNGDFLVREIGNYPGEEYRPPLNMLAISPNAPVFRGGEGLDIRG